MIELLLMRPKKGRSKRVMLFVLLAYLLIVVLGAAALWIFIPQRVKDAVYQTYVDPDSTQMIPP